MTLGVRQRPSRASPEGGSSSSPEEGSGSLRAVSASAAPPPHIKVPPQEDALASSGSGSSGGDGTTPGGRTYVRDGTFAQTPIYVRYDFVLSGYRYHFSFAEALRNVFSLHFETLNIWSHAAGMLYFLLALPRVGAMLDHPRATAADAAHYYGFVAAGAAQMGLSCVYHTFRCMSAEWEAALLRLDIAGVVAMILGSYGIALYNGFWAACRPGLYAVYLGVTMALLGSGVGLMLVPAFQEPKWNALRNAVLASTVAFGVVPALHWAALPTCDAACVSRFGWAISKMFACYGAGFAVFTYKIPERWWPGSFDLAGSSHNLWHLLVLGAGSAWLEGMLEYYAWRRDHAALDCAAVIAPVADAAAGLMGVLDGSGGSFS